MSRHQRNGTAIRCSSIDDSVVRSLIALSILGPCSIADIRKAIEIRNLIKEKNYGNQRQNRTEKHCKRCCL